MKYSNNEKCERLNYGREKDRQNEGERGREREEEGERERDIRRVAVRKMIISDYHIMFRRYRSSNK